MLSEVAQSLKGSVHTHECIFFVVHPLNIVTVSGLINLNIHLRDIFCCYCHLQTSIRPVNVPHQGHHLAKKDSIAGDVARKLGRVTEEVCR